MESKNVITRTEIEKLEKTKLQKHIDKKLQEIEIEEAIIKTCKSNSKNKRKILNYLFKKIPPLKRAYFEFTFNK